MQHRGSVTVAFAGTAVAALLIAATPSWSLPSRDPSDLIPETDGRVYDLEQVGHIVYIGGDFTRVGGTPRANLAAIDIRNGRVTSWNPGANNTVVGMDVAPDGQSIYVTGKFRTIDGKRRKKVAQIRLDGSLTSWQPALAGGRGHTIEATEDRVYVGGRFTKVNGSDADQYLTALDAHTGDRIPWAPGLDDEVWDIEVDQDGDVWVGGHFDRVDGDGKREGLVEIEPSGALTSFKPAHPVALYDVDVGPTGDRVFVAAGGGGGHVIAYDTSSPSGSLLWKAKTNGDVQAIEATPTAVFAAGHHSVWQGKSSRNVVSADPETGALLSWSASTGGGKGGYELVATDDGLWIAGIFARVSGENHMGFAFFPG